MLHAEELEAIQSNGARLLVVCNEHPEVLERCEPKAEDELKVKMSIKKLYKAKTMRWESLAMYDKGKLSNQQNSAPLLVTSCSQRYLINTPIASPQPILICQCAAAPFH